MVSSITSGYASTMSYLSPPTDRCCGRAWRRTIETLFLGQILVQFSMPPLVSGAPSILITEVEDDGSLSKYQAQVAHTVNGTTASQGFHRSERRRCESHFRVALEDITNAITFEDCARACLNDNRCNKFSLRLNYSSESGCFLFDSLSACRRDDSWTTGEKDLRCGVANDNELLHLQCPFGMQISEIFFANFGTPQGSCGAFSNGTCSSPDAKDVISDLCLGENECQVVASSSVFGSACSDMQNRLAVQIGCQAGPNYNEDTYFNAWSSRYWSTVQNQIEPKTDEWKSYLHTLPEYPANTFSGRGIIIVAGGHYLEPALVMIKMIREYGCRLRIQVWYLGEREMTSEHELLLHPYEVELRNFEDYVDADSLNPIQANVGMRLFQLKPLAVLHSDLEEVLLLDSDNCPIRDPSYLFEEDGFQEIGTVFWPDFWKTSVENPIWQIIGQDPSDGGWEQESGQLMVKKAAAWKAINLCVHFNSDFYMKLLNGDKDTFRFAWLASGTEFLMIDIWPTPVGTLKELHTATDEGFCGHTMLQYDFDGNALFVHHNQLKMTALSIGENFKYQKKPNDRTKVYKAAPAEGLILSNGEILSCIDIVGTNESFGHDDSFEVVMTDLLDFEVNYFAARLAFPKGISDTGIARTATNSRAHLRKIAREKRSAAGQIQTSTNRTRTRS